MTPAVTIGSGTGPLVNAVAASLHRLTIDARNRIRPVEAAADGTVSIGCGGRRHRARAIDGTLTLDAHDLDAELALLAFGGAVPTCLVYFAVWQLGLDDSFLAEWAADPDGERLAHTREEWFGNYWENWPSEPSAARALFRPRLQRQLAVGATRRWVLTRGPDGPGAGWVSVRRAVASRARRSVVASLAAVEAHRRPDALVPVAIEVVPDGDPSLAGRLAIKGSRVAVTLPVRWLWAVWANDLTIDEAGCFVVDVDDRSRERVVWRPTGAPGREHVPVIERQPVVAGTTTTGHGA